jgi:hypothetical protein
VKKAGFWNSTVKGAVMQSMNQICTSPSKNSDPEVWAMPLGHWAMPLGVGRALGKPMWAMPLRQQGRRQRQCQAGDSVGDHPPVSMRAIIGAIIGAIRLDAI